MKYILKLDNGILHRVNFNGTHIEAIKAFTGTNISGAQVLFVYKTNY